MRSELLDGRGARLVWRPLKSAALVGTVAAFAFLLAGQPADALPPASGDWTIVGAESYANQTIVVNGSIWIGSGAALTLTNISLEINSTASARHGIYIANGGTFTTRDTDDQAGTSADRTVIRPYLGVGAYAFSAEQGSVLNMRQTLMTGVGYTQSPINASGVYLDRSVAQLSNLTVSYSYFGIVFAGSSGVFYDLWVNNNTYNGIDVSGAAVISFYGLLAVDNGLSGAHITNGTVNVFGASFINNTDGFAVKFGSSGNFTSFDSSANDNGVIALNGARINMTAGRIANNTAVGVDARLASFVGGSQVFFSDNPTQIYATGASTFAMAGGGFLRGTTAFYMRTGANVTLSDSSARGLVGQIFNADNSTAEFTRVLFDGNADGGDVVSGTIWVFIDCTVSNSTFSGIRFTNSFGVLFVNPTFLSNRGVALSFLGSTLGIISAPLAATLVNSNVSVGRINITGRLSLENSSLSHGTGGTWNVSGSVYARNSSILPGAGGGNLVIYRPTSVDIVGLGVLDSGITFVDNPSGPFRVDGLSVDGSGEVAAAFSTVQLLMSNVSATNGAGVRAMSATLELRGGRADALFAQLGATIWLRDFTGNLTTALYTGGARIFETWSVVVHTQWSPTSPAGLQPVTISNASSGLVASGTTNAQGDWAAGYLLSRTGFQTGVVSENPHSVTAGTSTWIVSGTASIVSPLSIVVNLNDNIAPQVAISTPADGAALSANPVIIAGNTVDGESGLASVEWSYDNSTFNSGALSGTFSLSVATIFEATYTITVRVRDRAGNAGYDTVVFTIDRTAPFIVLSAPTEGSTLKGPDIRFMGRTEAGVALTAAGSPISIDAFGDFDQNLTLADGPHTILFLATDGAGNQGSATVNITVDSLAPAIFIDGPLNGTVTNAASIYLVGRVEPGATFAWDGFNEIVAPNGSFNATLFLDVQGANTFTLSSVDRAGNTNSTLFVIFRDSVAPRITVEGLTGGGPFWINSTRPTFNIIVDENATISALVTPSGSLASGSGMLLVFLPALTEGNSTMIITAIDAALNGRNISFELRLDVSGPSITVDAATLVGIVRTSPWTITVTAEPGANVTIGGQPAAAVPGSLGQFRAQVALQEGANNVSIVALDSAGNRVESSVVIRLDSVPPSLSIDEPAEGLRTPDRTVVVRGSTDPGSNVSVGGTPVSVDANGRWSLTVTLNAGGNNIVITATDEAGNQNGEILHVTRTTGSAGFTGVPFIDDNLGFLLILMLLLVVAAAAVAGARRRRRAAGDRATAIERDLEGNRALRNDISGIENFTPRGVRDPDFRSMDSFSNQLDSAPQQPPARPPRK